jgi:hypothetical protein
MATASGSILALGDAEPTIPLARIQQPRQGSTTEILQQRASITTEPEKTR